MRHYYSEHFMTCVLAELRKGKSATQIKIDVTAPSMKTLLAVTFAKALSELPEDKVRKCWFGLQKAFPSDERVLRRNYGHGVETCELCGLVMGQRGRGF